MNQAQLEQARDYALTGGGAGMITRGGKVVLSWGNTSQGYPLLSTTKSIGVTVLGLAMDDGLVSLGDLAKTHFSDVGTPPVANEETGWLDEITLLHLATHTAGFDKDGGFISQLFQPGTTWAYSDGGANWLADTLTVVYGQDLNDLMYSRVFTPIGIDSGELLWRTIYYRPETINGINRREFGSGITANVNAMARIGYLYLRRGLWEGVQILPETFIDQVSQPEPSIAGLPIHLPASYPDAPDHYGLLWWNNGDATLPNVPVDAYWSWGLYESLIIVIPSLDIVVSRAGSGWRPGWDGDYSVLEPFLLPIVLSALDVIPPTAEAGGPYIGNEGSDIAVDGSASDDPVYGIFSHAWDLDDDGLYDEASGPTALLNTTTSGALTIGLKITSVSGALATDVAAVTVNNVPPSAEAGGPYSTFQGLSTTLSAAGSTDPGNDIFSYEWDLDNDGQYDDATGETGNHTWLIAGGYAVGLRVTDADGASDTGTAAVTVQEPAPPALTTMVVSPAPAETPACVPLQLDVTGYDQYGATIPANPLWSAGGGTIASNGMFVASVPGDYTVTATQGSISAGASVDVMGDNPRTHSLAFDGVDDFVGINQAAELDLSGGALTVAAWIRPTGWGESGQGRIVDHGGGSSGSQGWALHVDTSTDSLRFQINNDFSFNNLADDNSIILNTWQHVAVTLMAGTLTFYVDGAPRGVRTGVPTPAARSAPLNVGRRISDGLRAFNGGIDEIRLWNRALSPTEIAANMQVSLSGTETGLVAYYRFDEASGQTAIDSAGNGHDGQLGNSSGSDTEDPGRAVEEPTLTDTDADGFGGACDCDDGDASVYPNAPEVNDGTDNQCPGDQGYGVIDETSGISGFNDPADLQEYSWTAQSGATLYEIARSARPDFTLDCSTTTTADTFWIDVQTPPAGGFFFYVSRPLVPNIGSWGQNSTGAERVLTCP